MHKIENYHAALFLMFNKVKLTNSFFSTSTKYSAAAAYMFDRQTMQLSNRTFQRPWTMAIVF